MPSRIRFLPAVAGIFAACAASVALGQQNPPQPRDEQTPWRAELIVVTPNRSEQSAATVPASVSVITRADIERIQPPDLLELLRLEAGIDITRNGGPGGQTSIFVRGSNSNHVLVLIDGVRVAASGTGAFQWETLDPAVIERVEIVRGPRAARWGSDAIGGVIQIFTRRPDGVAASARYGSDDDRRGVFAVGNQQSAVPLDLTVAARRVDGFSAQNPRGFAFDPDDDGFENLSAATGGGVDVAGGALTWRGRAATGETEFDQGTSDYENWSWRFDYRREGAGPWTWQAGVATLRDRLETETAFGASEVVTRRLQADLLAERGFGTSGVWLIGVDAWRESGVDRGAWDETRTNVGVFTGIEGRGGPAGYEFSLRADDDEEFGTELTGNAGVQWRFDDRWRAFASAGRGFRAPNFNQLYSPGFSGGLFAGNPDLDPERSWSVEAGLRYRPSVNQRVTLSAYSNWIDDLIAFAGTDFEAINVNEARIRGLELRHGLTAGAWRSNLDLTLQDPEDRDADRDLLRRAEFKGSWALDYAPTQRWNLGGELVHVGSRLDVGGVALASYTLVNLRSRLHLRENWHLELRVDNVTDRDYEPLVGFNAADRRVFVELGWRG